MSGQEFPNKYQFPWWARLLGWILDKITGGSEEGQPITPSQDVKYHKFHRFVPVEGRDTCGYCWGNLTDPVHFCP
jgi:hypothetical protein